jgi:excisionase family DNA binding protein
MVTEQREVQFLSIREAARVLSMSEVTVRRYVASRELGSTKIGRSRRIPMEAIRRLAEAGATEGRSDRSSAA